MKILVVSYLPNGQNSRTKKLVDTFVETTKGKNKIEHLDLIKEIPDFITPENLNAYMQRNYMGKQLSNEQKKKLEKFDKMTKQFKAADIVVVAFPMYNFSMPAAMKAYFDSIMQKGETWDINENGFVGLMQGKKALILTSSGGIYVDERSSYEHSTSLAKVEFGFMGFTDVKSVSAQGVNMGSNQEEIVRLAQEEVKKVIKEWEI
nr:hypothetical protein [Nanoarchaeum sp.]